MNTIEMIVPSFITSGYQNESESESELESIALPINTITDKDKDKDEDETTTTHSNKRQRLMSEQTLLEEDSSMPQGTTVKSMATTTAASFSVAIADHDHDNNHPLTTASRPTFEELSKELCKIVDTDHYSRNEAIQALSNICQWGGYSDDKAFLSDFLELGGIQRVLIYLKNNKGDPTCVAMAAKVIMACTYRGPAHQSFDVAKDIVEAFVKRDGIQILLLAGNKYDGENIASQLEALRWIWAALMNITDKHSAYNENEFGVGIEQQQQQKEDQLLAVFDSGLDTMAKLGKCNAADKPKTMPFNVNNNNTIALSNSSSSNQKLVVAGNISYAIGSADYQLRAVQWVFSSFCGGGGSRKRAAIDSIAKEGPQQLRTIANSTTRKTKAAKTYKGAQVDNSKVTSLIMGLMFSTWLNIAHNSPMTRDAFLGMNLFQKCIESLKKPNGTEWINNKDLLVQASRFFVQCCEKNILSTKEDFEVAFPLVVECISKYPEASYHGGLFELVKEAYSVVDKSFMQGSGVVGAIATAWESDDVDEATKDASHQLLKELL